MLRRLAFFTVMLLATAAHADGKGKVLVLDMGGTGVDADLMRSLSDVLVTAAREKLIGRFEVVSQADIATMISHERQKDLLGCNETSCFAEIGGALGADRLVAGSLGKIGALYVITIRHIDTVNSRVLGHVQDKVEGKVEILAEAVTQLTRSLLDPDQPYGLGFVRLREPGTLKIDGKARRAPVDREAVLQGSHEVVFLDPDGGEVWKQHVEIPPYQVTLLQAPIGPPWYTRWWLWTGVVVVAGGAAAAYLLTRPGPAAPGPASGNVTVTVHP
jgi:hypothetical protein